MKPWSFPRVVVSLILLVIAPAVLVAQSNSSPNPNCTLIVPANPLSATGLATPYQLVATNPDNGDCHEANANQSAFVQAAILDPATGAVSIYNPLVIDQGSTPAAAPVMPTLPANAVVATWFGYNGDVLTLQAADGVLQANRCVNGLPNSNFGQFAYCNAPAFFKAARHAIRSGQLSVPPLGVASDGRPCPSVRDFSLVDQDQSDNLPVSYLLTSTGLAQKTQANLAAFPGATTLGNPSDNGLLDKFVAVALGCTPWKASDLADPGQMVPALPLNELQAKAYQQPPVALIPAGDPMVLNNNAVDLVKVNAYRRGVDQPHVGSYWEADTARYCRHLFRIAPARLLVDQSFFTPEPSPVPDLANSLFTFMAQRFVASYDILGCADLIHKPDPVSVTTDSQGVAISATINVNYRKWRRDLAADQQQDDAEDDAASPASPE
jgi:hypothetical protein